MLDTYVIGIDPGRDGGLAGLSRDGRLVTCARMPLRITRKTDGGERAEIDEDALAALLRTWGSPAEAWIEDVWASSQMGVVGAFSFGTSKGIPLGVLAGLGIPRRRCAPILWKDRMGVMVPRRPGTSAKQHKKGLKAAAIKRAQTLFPTHVKALAHDGVAEAALIATFGLLSRKGS